MFKCYLFGQERGNLSSLSIGHFDVIILIPIIWYVCMISWMN